MPSGMGTEVIIGYQGNTAATLALVSLPQFPLPSYAPWTDPSCFTTLPKAQ